VAGILIFRIEFEKPSTHLKFDFNSSKDENHDKSEIYRMSQYKSSVPHDEAMAEMYRKDPQLACDLLNSILEDGNQGELLIVLRQMTKAFGGVQAVAEKANLNPTQLYRTLSPDGNPALSSFTAIVKAMGMKICLQPA
jgi:probable addiction module antidote protein